MSVSDPWDRFVILRNSITRRDKDGRLKLKGLSKAPVDYLVKLYVRLTIGDLTRKQWLEAIEHFVNTTDEELFLEELSARDGAIDLRAHANPDLIATLAEQMSATLEEQGAGNYCEWKFHSHKTGKGFTLLVQRQGRMTPAQKRAQLREDIEAVAASWESRGNTTIKKSVAANLLRQILLEDAK